MDGELTYVPLTGWLARGQHVTQSFKGWQVYAARPAEDAVPVVIVSRVGWWRRMVLRILLGRRMVG